MGKKFTAAKKNVYAFVDRILEGDYWGLAAEMSFYILSSFFPIAVLLFTAASAISLSYTNALLEFVDHLPHQISDLLKNMITNPLRSATIIATTGIFTLFTVAGLISSIEKSLNRFYKLENKRSYITSKLIGFFFSILIFISIIASFGLIIFGSIIGDYIHKVTSDSRIEFLWDMSRYILVFLFITMVVSALYKALPTVKVRIRDVIPGAVFTTVLWYVSSILFALYINNFPQYEIIYGSLAGFVCLILWIYLTGIAFVSGAKINGLLYLHKLEKEGKNNIRF